MSEDNLYRLATHFCNLYVPQSIPHADREDIVQEIAIALYKARERFNPAKSSWYNYATLRARGTIKDYLRDNPIEGNQFQRTTGEIVYLNSFNPEIHADTFREEYDDLELRELLQPFSLRQRLVLLCLIHGYSQPEIAKMLGISVKVVGNILFRCRIESLRYYGYAPRDTAA